MEDPTLDLVIYHLCKLSAYNIRKQPLSLIFTENTSVLRRNNDNLMFIGPCITVITEE